MRPKLICQSISLMRRKSKQSLKIRLCRLFRVPMSTIIELQNVSFAYQKNKTEYEPLILESVNLSIEKNSLVFFVGESGVGKSSLLRLINGLESPASGDIYFHGENMNALNPCLLRRKISLLQQVPVMFPVTVEENLNLSPGASKVNSDEKKEILNVLGLNENSLGKIATELSIGQAQRVAFVRCLMNQPEVILLDEPTASLDQKNKMKLFETIMKYTKEGKMTVLWVTHDLSLIEEYPFKKFRLKDKRIYEI